MTLPEDPIRKLAPAKVNLSLRITGRRDDGYHLLDSLVAFTDFGDYVAVSEAESLTLIVDGPFAAAIPNDESNIVLKAARALQDHTGAESGAEIRLTKNLPAAAGVGGGSSDAAATLSLLNRHWNTDLAGEEIADLALTLGADVPVCLARRPCRMRGIGDVIDPIHTPECGIVLVNPLVPCSTAAVFRRRAGEFNAQTDDLSGVTSVAELAQAVDTLGNDLLEPARQECPAIGSVLAILAGVPGVLASAMSGSGATCFALFSDRDAAANAARYLDGLDDATGWWIQSGGLGGDG